MYYNIHVTFYISHVILLNQIIPPKKITEKKKTSNGYEYRHKPYIRLVCDMPFHVYVLAQNVCRLFGYLSQLVVFFSSISRSAIFGSVIFSYSFAFINESHSIPIVQATNVKAG